MKPHSTRFVLTLSLFLFTAIPAQSQLKMEENESQLGPTLYEKRLEACQIKAGDVQAEPFFKDGQLSGFRYVQIRAGSAYSRAGFKPGDILIAQNGVQLLSPDDIVRAFQSVKEGEPQISTVLRGEKQIQFKMKCIPRKKKS